MSNQEHRPNTEGKYKWIGTRPDRPDGADKVTGRARFGADFSLPGQLIGKVLRSPHAHAVIKSIDTSKAEALTGVKAVITAKDFPDQPNLIVPTGEMQVNMRDVTRNIMAREKALYEGHPVAAVAATSEAIAKQALALIKVDYKVLPHVIDVAEAMKPGAPILHDHLLTEGANPPATKPSNIAKRIEFKKGDAKAGFAQAEVVIEKDFTTQAVHQGYIEPHATLASAAEDGQVQCWSTTQGHFQVRGFCARLLGLDTSQIRVTPTEIGGGFGGKTVVYLEPLAIRLQPEVGQAGEDDDGARGRVPRLRPGAGRQRQGQDRRHQGRPHRRRRVHRRDAGGRLPGLAGGSGLHVQLRLLRHRERLHRGLRCREQPAQGRGLSRARRADLGVGRGIDARYPGPAAQDGSDRSAPEERRQGGHQDGLWRDLQHHRHGRDPAGDQGLRRTTSRR